MGDNGSAVSYFNVGDPVSFYDVNDPTDPHPAPGFVTAANGANDYDVEVTLADMSTRIERHVGAQEPAIDPDPSPSTRWIELRDREAGPL